jgi:ArsR family transcriptional regulator
MPYSLGTRQPLYEIKANLFKALAHPARIRVLEILSAHDAPVPVSEILVGTGLEASLLSQHLAVLKRHGVVRHERAGNAVHYRLAHPAVAELLITARTFLADTLADRRDQLDVLATMPAIDVSP